MLSAGSISESTPSHICRSGVTVTSSAALTRGQSSGNDVTSRGETSDAENGIDLEDRHHSKMHVAR